jgi:predicted enzyme related to lactoylglutathione lyase
VAARLVACNIPTQNHDASNNFYQALLGLEPARSLTSQLTSYHVPISNDGQYLWLSDRTVDGEQPMAVFAVDNLDQSIQQLTQAGGQQFGDVLQPTVAQSEVDYYSQAVKRHDQKANPSQQMGRFAYMRDPDGNVLALYEVSGGAEAFYATTKRKDLNNDVKSAHQRAVAEGKKLH